MKIALYLERRLMHSAFLLIAISVLAFLTSQLAPGNFLDEMRLNPQISPETIDGLRAQYGLDQPLTVRYFRWLKSIAAGEFGYSLAYNLPVEKLLGARLRNTLLLGTIAMILAWSCALLLGVMAAWKNGGWIDRLSAGLSTVLLGTPELALGLLALLAAAHFGTLSPGGIRSATANTERWNAAKDIVRHAIIPTLVLATGAFPVILRHVCAALGEAWNSPFIQAARGHGISESRLLLRHALPSAANPLISLFGLSLAALVSGSFLVEVITGWPGLGPLFLESVYARDFHVVIAIVMVCSVFLILANLIADILLYAADPRVRAEC